VDDAGVRADDESMPGRHRRGWVLAGVALVVLLLSGASSHAATAPSSIGSVALRPVYHDRYISLTDVATLQREGLATAPAVNRELVCQGVEVYFDTNAERDAFQASYAARYPVEPAYLAGDPCLPFRDSPRYVDGS